MELKVYIMINGVIYIKFQSHLYGIERSNNQVCDVKWNSFNRTFMELKATTITGRGGREAFQSHLYGIERPRRMRQLSRTRSFQSHLYGIESLVCLTQITRLCGFNRTFMELKGSTATNMLHMSTVSIAPLWNWKERWEIGAVHQYSFNRTFMELKDYLSGSYSEASQVSIAPLWNWKQAAPRR